MIGTGSADAQELFYEIAELRGAVLIALDARHQCAGPVDDGSAKGKDTSQGVTLETGRYLRVEKR